MEGAEPEGKTALIDTEEGNLPVRHLPNVEIFLAKTQFDLEKALETIWSKPAGYYSRVVFDTISTASTTAMLNLSFDPSKGRKISVWGQKADLQFTQADWGEMSKMLIYFTRNLFELPGSPTTVILCHEGEREHPIDGTKIASPDLNRMLLKDVYGLSDVVLRLGKVPQKIDIDGVSYPAGTRILRLLDAPRYLIKERVSYGTKLPELFPNPTLTKYLNLFDPALRPRKILIYGGPGVGKTTFSCF